MEWHIGILTSTTPKMAEFGRAYKNIFNFLQGLKHTTQLKNRERVVISAPWHRCFCKLGDFFFNEVPIQCNLYNTSHMIYGTDFLWLNLYNATYTEQLMYHLGFKNQFLQLFSFTELNRIFICNVLTSEFFREIIISLLTRSHICIQFYREYLYIFQVTQAS